MFSPYDAHILYFAANTLWKTSNGGINWTQISPDVARPDWDLWRDGSPGGETPVEHRTAQAAVEALIESALALEAHLHGRPP